MNSVFKEFYSLYHKDIYSFLFYMTKNRELTEDLVQEVYIRIIKSYERFEGKSTMKTWALSIARNVAIDHFRKENTLKKRLFSQVDWKDYEIRDTNPIPEDVIVQSDRVRLLYQCLDKCTIDQRMVIVYRYIQDLSIAETAQVLGWTESKVKTTQHRALKVLKKHLEMQLEKEGES